MKHSQPDLIVPSDLKHSQPVIESVDREIGFVRRRSGQIYFILFLIEVLILAGRERLLLPKEWTWQGAAVNTAFFFAVAFIGIFLGQEYRRRIHVLKDSRMKILARMGYENVFPSPLEKARSEIKVLYYVLILLSVAGTALLWINL